MVEKAWIKHPSPMYEPGVTQVEGCLIKGKPKPADARLSDILFRATLSPIATAARFKPDCVSVDMISGPPITGSPNSLNPILAG
jgi:hypothetical protein